MTLLGTSIDGLHVPAGEPTRASFMLRLSDTMRPMQDMTALQSELARQVVDHLGASRAGFASDFVEGMPWVLGEQYPNAEALTPGLRYAVGGDSVLQTLRSGRRTVRHESQSQSQGFGAALDIPLMREGQLAAVFFVHFRLPHAFTTDELAWVDDIASRVWNTVERMRLETDLRHSEACFSSMLDQLPTLAWMASPDGEVFWYNRPWHEYTGMQTQDVRGRGWESVQHPDHLQDVRAHWETSLRTGERFEMTAPLRDAEGQFKPFLTRVVPLKDDTGRITGWFGTHTDLSAERDLQARLAASVAALREADRRKDEILATLSHELRNPLAPILTASMLLGSASLTPDKVAAATQVIQRQVRHMARLLDDLLQMAQLTQGRLALQPVHTRLHDVVEASIETVRPLLDRKEHALSLDLPAQDVWLLVDGLRVSQILSNLLNNAAKYTAPQGAICLRARVEASNLCLQIEDNGMGLPSGMGEDLFTMFARRRDESHHAEGGLGIGLALTKGLVELHQGRIEAISAGTGQGTRMAVTLPLAPAPAIGQGGMPSPRAGNRLRVMVVDDNQDAADTLLLLIEQDGHEVRVAHGGSQALTLASEFRPDVALIDIGMPGMDGHAVAQALRTRSWGTPLTLIALTGWGQ